MKELRLKSVVVAMLFCAMGCATTRPEHTAQTLPDRPAPEQKEEPLPLWVEVANFVAQFVPRTQKKDTFEP